MIELPGYELLAKIDESANSIVYRSIRDRDRQPVILKFFKSDYPTPEEIARYKQEYEIIRHLNLESVVRAYDLLKYQNSLVIVLEDFGGDSLRKLSVERKFTLLESLDIAIQIADGLGQVHQKNIIHKDINPANIILNPKTGIVKLIDFGIATVLTHENPIPINPNVLEGTLAYMSPEQTGRMNRVLDYHTDFYSLGVTLYELLTGQLPYEATDMMELVHCHLAKQATPPGELNSAIPSAVSDIVVKLLAKIAEDRYQSAYGIKADLQKCLEQLNNFDKIENFTLGQQDISEKFQIPQKLYGREREVEILLSAFDRIAAANSPSQVEMMLVSGYSGIGKTSLIQEIYKPITRQRGYFISGKFDQFQRNIPYSAIVNAFSDLVQQLLTESEAELSDWRARILTDLGANCQIIINVIPEVELIVGKQPAVIDLPPTEAQNRFKLVFQNFIKVFTKPKHPLVVFLDDLQWADSASLNLIQLLTTVADTVRRQDFSSDVEKTESPTTNLFLIGAYRDNEVDTTHPLILTLNEVQKAGVVVNHISLSPLALSTVNRLIADTIGSAPEKTLILAELVLTKTRGNPFFINEFLKSLYAENLLKFDSQQRNWQWSLEQIQARNITDNVVELLATKIQQFSEDTQKALQFAACIGNEFDLQTLAYVSEKFPQEIAAQLWEAVDGGLILSLGRTGYREFLSFLSSKYKFAHDRIQQAAYSLIPEYNKQAFHLQIGQLLLQNTPPSQREQKIFDIVNQLNFGSELISEPEKREELSELNLIAGKKAKASSAYEPAVRYLTTGLKLLSKNAWQTHYNLALMLYIEIIEAEYLNTNFERATALAEIALKQGKTLLDRVKIYEAKILISISQLQMIEAVETGLQVLEKLGIVLLPIPTKENLVIKIPSLTELENMPVMNDPTKLAGMRILKIICTPVFQAKPEIFPQLILTIVNFCIEHGNSRLSAFAYGFYGLLLSGMGQIDEGYHAGNLALKLLDKFDAKELKAKVYNLFNSNIRIWKEPAKNSIAPLQEGVKIGLETGDIEWGGYCAANFCGYIFFTEENLQSVIQQQSQYIDLARKIKQEITIYFSCVWKQLGLNLQGKAEDRCLLVGEAFNEVKMLPQLIEAKTGTVLFVFYVAKTILYYSFKEYRKATEMVSLAMKQVGSAFGFMQVAVLNFYESLALLGDYSEANDREQKKYLIKIKKNQIKMKFWVVYAPANFKHKFALVEAEKLRVLGQNWKASEYYDLAIKAAAKEGYIQEAALANELAAKFYLTKGKNKIAAVYLEDARYCYQVWGATAKVKDLDESYPELLAKNSSFMQINKLVTTSGNQISSTLDLATVIKASQSIAGEIVLEKLLTKLMNILIENAGAEAGFLILSIDGKLSIASVLSVNSNTPFVLSSPLEKTNQNLPETVIKYVERTQKDVVLTNAASEGMFTADPYIASNQLKSILCTPIINQNKLIAILYLENNLTVGAFTADRLEVLRLLSSQAAISIENALLYANLSTAKEQLEEYSKTLEVKVEERTQELKVQQASLSEAQRLAHLGSWSVDLVTPKVTWSEEVFRIFGLNLNQPAPELPEFLQMVHPDDVAWVQKALEEIIHSGKSYEIDYRILRTDGSIRYITAKVEATLNDLARVVKLFGTVLDITDRKLAEKALMQSEAQLKQTLQELQCTQAQLIQTEKMSGLGQMVAGVAHEINNPVSFIYGNLSPANQYVQELLNLIEIYQQEYPNPTKKIQQTLEDIDLEFIVPDLQKLMNSMKAGADRIRTIVLSLRNFARLDESDMKPVDIHEGIDSTLLILQHRLRNVKDGQNNTREIQAIKEYGKLPLVTCYASQLNQVFLHILNNAIDALQERMKNESDRIIQPPMIRICTKVTDANVIIRIADNGIGMTESVIKNIFNPFFTTKPVGSATGLGLSVCYQIIVEKHGGKINCISETGQGAELAIQIPINPTKH